MKGHLSPLISPISDSQFRIILIANNYCLLTSTPTYSPIQSVFFFLISILKLPNFLPNRITSNPQFNMLKMNFHLQINPFVFLLSWFFFSFHLLWSILVLIKICFPSSSYIELPLCSSKFHTIMPLEFPIMSLMTIHILPLMNGRKIVSNIIMFLKDIESLYV